MMLTAPANETDKLDWLRLIRSEGVGPRTFYKLIGRFGDARTALEALPQSKRAAKPAIVHEVERGEKLGGRLVARGEPPYPDALAAIPDAPPLIWMKGDISVLDRPCVAIVGARNASAHATRFARILARDLGAAGQSVVSGLARGVDRAAHEASLETGTIGVNAGGLGALYPAEHGDLFEAMTETGLIITERPPGWTPRAQDFPARNRIIAGLCWGLAIIEAAGRSGSLITARYALDFGREVFAVPGFPTDPRATGTNRLIKDGAPLITEAADILSAYRAMPLGGDMGRAGDLFAGPMPTAEPIPLDDALPASIMGVLEGADSAIPDAPVEDSPIGVVRACLSTAPIEADMLVRETGLSVAAVNAALTDLIMAGDAVEVSPGRYASR